jgi:hypothetical protein
MLPREGRDYLTRTSAGVANVTEHGDVRKALIVELASTARSGR